MASNCVQLLPMTASDIRLPDAPRNRSLTSFTSTAMLDIPLTYATRPVTLKLTALAILLIVIGLAFKLLWIDLKLSAILAFLCFIIGGGLCGSALIVTIISSLMNRQH
ncbi:hypothetical protein HDE_11583 [Halotydeus destructor]|nr:hypothetical protein HDE_11583 [Halotydeus destructor]